MNKKALSQIIGTVLLIALTLGLIVAVWGTVNSFVSNRLEKAGDCKDIFEKISFNNDYTCYNTTANVTIISINVEEIEIESLLLAVYYGNSSNVYKLTNNSQIIPNLLTYSGSSSVAMPPKESGRAYIVNKSGRPTRIEISPKIGNTQCETVDYIGSIRTCVA